MNNQEIVAVKIFNIHTSRMESVLPEAGILKLKENTGITLKLFGLFPGYTEESSFAIVQEMVKNAIPLYQHIISTTPFMTRVK